jgi:hypothetical protein
MVSQPLEKSMLTHEMARVILLTSEQWFFSGTENTDGGLIINLNEMQRTPGLYQSKETSTIYFFKQFTYVLPIEDLHVTSSMTSPMVAAMLEVFFSRRAGRFKSGRNLE